MTELHPWVVRLDHRTFLATFPAERTLDETRAFWATLERHYADGVFPARFGYVLDLSQMRRSDPRARALMAEHLRAEDAFYRARCVGLAVVVRSAVARGVLQAMSWLVPNKPSPMKTVDSVEAGRAYLDALFATEDEAGDGGDALG